MKINQKQLKLIKYGLKPSTVTNLSESQVNALYKNLLESNKKETKEQKGQPANTTQQTITTTKYTVKPNSKTMINGVEVDTTGGKTTITPVKETEMSEENQTSSDLNKLAGVDPYEDPNPEGNELGPSDNMDADDGMGELEEEYKRLMEKFESKKQQKYFFAKCGDGKTKEQKKWCKMADEFASKTNFKKLPEKKKEETKESGMSNYTKKVASAFAGGLKKQLNNIPINPTFGESEMEKQILRLVEKHITPKMTKKDFLNLVKEQGTKVAPSRPDVKPDIDTPTKPSKPATPYLPKPGVKPAPKARKKMPEWLSFNQIGINLK